jgi:acyl carrier protein
MESIINAFISRELVSKPELLPLHHDSPLLPSGILDSLSVLKLVLFLEDQFGILIPAEDLIPAHFETVDAICAYLHTQHQVQGVQG